MSLRLWIFLSFFGAVKLIPVVSMAFLQHMWVRSKRMVGSSMWRQLRLPSSQFVGFRLSSTSSDGIIQVNKHTKPDNLNLHRDDRRALVKGKSMYFFKQDHFAEIT